MNIYVFSWNINGIGSDYKNNIQLMKNYLENNNDVKKCDILIIGLQEVSNIKKLEIEGFEMYRNKKTCIVPYFSIYTFIFHKKNIKILNNNIINKCFDKYGHDSIGGTKGMFYINLDAVKNKKYYNLSIINCHMPFKTEKTIKNYIQNMFKNINESENVILFGDLNSRSILTDDGYVKIIKSQDSNFLKILKELEELEYEKTNGMTKNKKIKDVLIKSDFLKNNINELLPNYKEKSINFLPTYNRHSNSGKFNLIRKNHQKLPGYADRIIYKGGELKQMKYTSVNIIGSDHLPVFSVFKMH